MPEYLAPGVYIEEIAGIRPIEGVGTSTAGFVGQTVRGPTLPKLVTSWVDFSRWYGSWVDPEVSYLPEAIRGFFENGGQRTFVSRVHRSDATTSTVDLPTAGVQTLRVSALGPGASGDRIYVRVADATQISSTGPRFRLTFIYYTVDPPQPLVDPLDAANITDPNRRTPDVIEDFDNLGIDPVGPNYVLTTVNAASRLVALSWNPAGAAPDVPTAQGFSAARLAGGLDGVAAVTSDIYTGAMVGGVATANDTPDRWVGLRGLELIDEVALLCIPDHVHPSLAANEQDQLAGAIVEQCERLKDRFAILSHLQGDPNVAGIRPIRDSTYGAFYYPWVRILDARSRTNISIPPAGHVAGIYARTDIERGVHKAPANEVVRGIVNIGTGVDGPLEFPVSKGMQDILNPRGVNCIRDFRADRRGIRVWGARTMSSDPEWKYVNVRRLFIYVEESIDEGTQWVVFEGNDDATWAKVRRSIGNFLTRVWRSGALMGATAEEAFFVKCDRTTMTQDDIDNGRLICYIGIAPVKPAEFVIFRISQKTADAAA